MYTEINISNLRGIREGSIERLKPLSLLVGPNNSGKSTILEAFRLLAQAGDAHAAFDIITGRGWCGFECSAQIHYGTSQESRVWGKNDGADVAAVVQNIIAAGSSNFRTVAARNTSGVSTLNFDSSPRVTSQTHPPLPDRSVLVRVETVRDSGSLEEAYSTALAKGREDRLQDLLERLGLHNSGLRILKSGDRYVLHLVTIDQPGVAVYFTGDGFKRLLYMACVLAGSSGLLVLLEEPESFLHPSYLSELARLIWGAVNQGTQIVLSTHSLDLLNQIILSEDAKASEFALFKTRLDGGLFQSSRIEGVRAIERVGEMKEDLRW